MSTEKSETAAGCTKNEDDSMNFASEKFDPLKALYCANVNLAASENIPQYDNLAMFERALKKIDPEGSKNPQKETPSTAVEVDTEASSYRRFLPHQMPTQGTGTMKLRHGRNVFNKMEKLQGPLSALERMVKNDVKIKVYTRKEKGIRGYITGRVLCFDNHWNLFLTDACEVWKRRKFKFSDNNVICGPPENCSKRLKALGIKIPQVEAKSLNRKYVECKRKVDQIFIRGEQVVLITTVEN